MKVDVDALRQAVLDDARSDGELVGAGGVSGGGPGGSKGMLEKCVARSGCSAPLPNSLTPPPPRYGTDLTQQARDGKLDAVIGRSAETARLVNILVRRRKCNPCLLGDPGVGKTAIVEGLAARIVEGSVPPRLRNATVVSVELAELLAGTKCVPLRYCCVPLRYCCVPLRYCCFPPLRTLYSYAPPPRPPHHHHHPS